MREKIKALLGVVAFYLLFTYLQPYALPPHIRIESPAFFQYLDSLTGYPILMSRIQSFLFCLVIYIFFTIVLERQNWKAAFFLQESPYGLLKGGAFAIICTTCALLIYHAIGLIDLKSPVVSYCGAVSIVFAWLVGQIFNAPKEEFIFRGYMLDRLARNFNVHLAISGSSTIFGLVHISEFGLPGVFDAAVGGIILGYMFVYYRNIWVPVGFHALYDALANPLQAGSFFALQPTASLAWLGAYADQAPMICSAMINTVLLIAFFVWKRLWLLPKYFEGDAHADAPRLRDGGAS
ncbi:CPBP family intramembrane glutamic endopeptidase [Phyllobacterium leguminum]|uniref:Membrane protease YdiL (CAAX protease family) n=1 Tax=Phyllobacterium leguminum TaxID=314237 RepID=A0A318SZA7_9HYPH|nr:CPBP family intramembrane glutamic endopeptidase [Phyllobacterium leguminum]PYE87199.1 membrane protease YdiL (CAAX protease family) [Phyllobacterium leguminum]